MFPACQGGHQHDKRTLRQMEVGDQGIHDLEAVAWINEDIGPSGFGLHMAILFRPALQGTAGSGAHADYAPTGSFGAIDEVCRFLRNHTVLAVHIMVRDLFLLHGTEGAKAYMQGDKTNGYAPLFCLCHQFLGKVKARGRGGSRAIDPGVNGLIPFLVLKLRFDIRGQRHAAQPFQYLQEDPLVGETDKAIASLHLLDDLPGKFAVSKGDLGSGAQLLPGTYQAFPDIIAPVDQQQNLAGAPHRSVTVNPAPQEPGRQNAGVIHNEAVSRIEQGRQFIKVTVLPLASYLVQHKETGAVPLLKRCLRNQFLREVKIKIMGFHRAYPILSRVIPVK